MKDKIIATEILEERANCDFDQNDYIVTCLGPDVCEYKGKIEYDLVNCPEISNKREFYEMSPEEK